MTVYRDDFKAKRDSAVALGFFDGVHLGHRKVIEAASKFAREYKILSGVFTFSLDEGQPFERREKLIDAPKIKTCQFMQLGVDYIYSPSFSEIENLSPEEFINEILVKRCRAKMVSCGSDFRFGKGAKGDTKLLKKLCEDRGLVVRIQSPVKHGGKVISSQKIKKLIAEGKMQEVKKLLGRSYRYQFVVEEGKKLGRKLGIPTINQYFTGEFVVPKAGVYVSKTVVDGKIYPSVTNLGSNPTFGEEFRAETHIIGYSGDLYGQVIQVRLFDYIRPEKKFETVEEMGRQIREDIGVVSDYNFT